MEHWLAQNALQLLGSLAAIGFFLIKLGEWKERRERDPVGKVDMAAIMTASATSGVSTALELGKSELRRDIAESELRARHGAIEHTTGKVVELAARLEKAGAESSRLAGKVQEVIGRLDRFPEEMRDRFLPLDRAEDQITESRRDRKSIWEAIEELRHIGQYDGPDRRKH